MSSHSCHELVTLWSLHCVSFFLQLMKLCQIKPEEETMTGSVTHLHTSAGGTDRLPISASPSTSMTFLRTMTSTARSDTPITASTLMNTPDPTRRHTAVIRDNFEKVLERILLRTCLRTLRECLPLTGTPNRIEIGFTVTRNNTVGQ